MPSIRPRLDDNLEDALARFQAAGPIAEAGREKGAEAKTAKPKSRFAQRAEAARVNKEAATPEYPPVLSLVKDVKENVVNEPVLAPFAISGPFGFSRIDPPAKLSRKIEHASTGDKEVQQAEEEADAIFKGVSTADIEKERAELEATMPAHMLDFLRNRKHGNDSKSESENLKQPVEKPAKAILEEEIIQNGPAPSTSTFEPSFNLSGKLVTISDETHQHTHAHHSHAQSQHTIPTLLAQTRSTIPQQRSFAIGQLEKIVAVSYTTGRVAQSLRVFYDLALDLIKRETHLGIFVAGIKLLKTVAGITVFVSTMGQAVDELLPACKRILSRHIDSPEIRLFAQQSVIQLLKVVQKSEFSNSIWEDSALIDLLTSETVAKAWPIKDNDVPLIETMDFLNDLCKHNRNAAETIVQSSVLNTIARYVALPYWQVTDDHRQTSEDFLVAVFNILSTLARYGLACEIRSAYSSVWTNIETHDWRLLPPKVCTSWLDLLKNWMNAAKYPHEHDHSITWSQFSEIGQILQTYADLLEGDSNSEVKIALLACWKTWTTGEERAGRLTESMTIGNFEELANKTAASLMNNLSDSRTNLKDMEAQAQLLLAILRIESVQFANKSDLVDLLSKESLYEQHPLFIELQCHLLSTTKEPDVQNILAILPHVKAGAETFGQKLAQILATASDLHGDGLWSALAPFFAGNSELAPIGQSPTKMSKIQRLLPNEADAKRYWGTVWPLKVLLDALFDKSSGSPLRQVPENWKYSVEDVLSNALTLLLRVVEVVDKNSRPTKFDLIRQVMRIYILNDSQTERLIIDNSECDNLSRSNLVGPKMESLLQKLPMLSDGSLDQSFRAEYARFLDLVQSDFPNFNSTVLALAPTLIAGKMSQDCRQILHEEHADMLPQMKRALDCEALPDSFEALAARLTL